MSDNGVLSRPNLTDLSASARKECVNILVALEGADGEPGSMMKRMHWHEVRTYAKRILEDAGMALGVLDPG